MLLHKIVTIFNAYLTYKRLKVLFSAQKNKTKSNRIGNKLTFEVLFCVFLHPKYNRIRGQRHLIIATNVLITSESEFGCEFKIYTQFYTQK